MRQKWSKIINIELRVVWSINYSVDLRQKVINYIESGGKITKAAKVFGIGRASIYGRKKLEATKVKHRHRKLNCKELEKYIKESPEVKLKLIAEKFGVSTTAIWAALKKIKNFVTEKGTEKKE